MATDSLSSKRSSRPKARAKTKSLTGISLDLEVRYKSHEKDDLLNAVYAIPNFQTRSTTPPNRTPDPVLYSTNLQSLQQSSFLPS